MLSPGCKADDSSIRRFGGQKGADLSRCARTHIVMMNNDSSSIVRFLNFCEDFFQINSGEPLRIDRPTMLMWNSRHMNTFVEVKGFLREELPLDLARIKDPHCGLLL